MLFDGAGRRKYLTDTERVAFGRAAEAFPREVRTFCHMLLYSGCRISEALALTGDRVDLASGTVVFETLKKRRSGVYRAVPVPPALLDALDLVHDVRTNQGLLWPWPRSTASVRVGRVMASAGVKGPQACPKGLRHGFGVACVERAIPLNMVQKWLGHADMATTAIYADAVGEEEQMIASRLWEY